MAHALEVDFVDELMRFIRHLNLEHVEYVIVGGIALNLHGLVRATEDLDVFVAPSADNIERLKRAMRHTWSDPQIDEISAEELCGEYPAVRYGPPVGSFYVDILTRLGDATLYEDLGWTEVIVGDTPVRVATPLTLYRMKRDTVRPVDRADAEALSRYFTWEEDK